MTSAPHLAMDHVERLRGQTTTDGVMAELRQVGGVYGFSNFAISGLPGPRERLDPYVLLSGWPEVWLRRYAEGGYIHADPVIRTIREVIEPVAWSECRYDADDRVARQVMGEGAEHGLAQGLAVPIYGLSGSQAIVTFGATRFEVSPEERSALHLIAIYAHNQAKALLKVRSGSPAPRPPRLSRRQMECVRWCSVGKSNWEIGAILGLSERTVEQYMADAARRLGARGRTHVVAEALRHDLIQ